MLKILAYLIVYTVWGSTYFFIKISVAELPPFIVVGIRFILGGILLLGYAKLVGALKILPTKKEVRNSVIIGILLLVGGNGLVSVAVKNVDSYLAALIVATTPMVVLFYDKFFFKKEISITGWIGTIVGLVGVALLLIKENAVIPSISVPAILVILAVSLWALGTSLTKIIPLPKNSIVNGGIQLFVVGIGTIFIANFFTPINNILWQDISMKVIGSVLYLSIFGSISLAAFAWLLYNEPNSRVMTYAFVNPLIAIILGILIGKEQPVPWLIGGTILIFTGLFLMFYVKPKGKSVSALVAD